MIISCASFSVPSTKPFPALHMQLLLDTSSAMSAVAFDDATHALRALLPRLRPPDLVGFAPLGLPQDMAVLAARCTPKQIDKLDTALAMATRSSYHQPLQVAVATAWPSSSQNLMQALLVCGVKRDPSEAEGLALSDVNRRCFVVKADDVDDNGPGLSVRVKRIYKRMSQQRYGLLRLRWDVTPQWQSDLPEWTYGGDTVRVLAGFTDDHPKQVTLTAGVPWGVRNAIVSGSLAECAASH